MSKRPATAPGVFTKSLAPTHFKGSTNKGSRLAKTAQRVRKKRVKWLRAEHPANPSARALARMLSKCSRKHRCLSGACPVCAQAAQEQFATMTKRFTAEMCGGQRKPKTVMAITLVPTDLTSAPGQLGEPTVAQVHRRITDRLARAKVRLAVGVLEVGLTEHMDERYPQAWRWHLHGMAITGNPETLKKRLAKAFPKKKGKTSNKKIVPHPVHATPWDGRTTWLRYCHKLDRQCRIGDDNQQRFDSRTRKERRCSGTSRRALTPKEMLELLLLHDGVSLDSRILTIGAQLRRSGDGCQIVRLRRTRR